MYGGRCGGLLGHDIEPSAPHPTPKAAKLGAWGRQFPPSVILFIDLQWTGPDHRLALCGDLRWQLVREGEVSDKEEDGEGLGRVGTPVVTQGPLMQSQEERLENFLPLSSCSRC